MSVEDIVLAVQNYERVKRERDNLKTLFDIASKQLEEKRVKLAAAEAELTAYEAKIFVARKD